MNFYNLYRWFSGNSSSLTNGIEQNKPLYDKATEAYRNIEASSTFLIILFIVLGILFCLLYYKWYNNRPGRHYTPKKWLIFLSINYIATFLISLLVVSSFVKVSVSGTFAIELKMAILNGLYASLVYLALSWIICQFNVISTNAYRFLKF